VSEYGVILFYTTSAAMRAEKSLVREGFTCKLIPTPRQFSSDCGISLRFCWEKHNEVELLLKRADIEFDAIYRL